MTTTRLFPDHAARAHIRPLSHMETQRALLRHPVTPTLPSLLDIAETACKAGIAATTLSEQEHWMRVADTAWNAALTLYRSMEH